MTIEKVDSWAYAGTNYSTEKEAVKAALTDIGSRLIKEFHSKPFDGLMQLGVEITPLRDRYLAILDLELQAEKGIPETAGEYLRGPELSLAELNAQHHTKACNARAVGYADSCDCPATLRPSAKEEPVTIDATGRRLAMRRKFNTLDISHPIRMAATEFMKRAGHADPKLFWTRATAPQFDELELVLAMAKQPT